MVATSTRTFELDALSSLELHHVEASIVTYRGRRAVRFIEREESTTNDHAFGILVDSDFKDGIIETAIAGAPRPDAPPDMRGFVGIAFRMQPLGTRFECFYLRPTNGRANDQLRRNHATQYVSHPDYPWYRLREETPGVYESYTDLVPGDWTPIRIVVSGIQAQLYVNGAEQPCLIVNDLKLGETRGSIALWIGAGTEAFFSTVVVK
ncbi:MAG: hypothetical protein HZB51_26645 [Chloroflexi bacterium]|nr:hypothetical protein [Chloroflexota bacterium]